MALIYLLFLISLLLICSVGPGLFFMRGLRWKPAETLCASIAASLVFVYLASMLIYCLDLPTASHWLLSGVCLGLTFLCRRDLLRLLKNRQVRRMLAALGILELWTLLILCLIRHYAGGTWSGDWLEHFQRSNFFLTQADLHYKFLGQYLLTDRPPLMNLVCAHYLAQAGERFEPYQITAAFLNLLPVLPCCLFASSIAGRSRGARRAAIVILIALLMANPMFIQNVTYVWTKSLAAFFALLGLWLYLRGWMKGDSRRIVAAFVTVTAGCLTHFYVVPWLAVMAVHYLLVVLPKRNWRELAAIIICCAALLCSWFGWAIYQYGPRTPFTSNLTINDGKTHATGDLAAKISGNLIATVVPHFLRHVPYSDFQQGDRLGYLRDRAFTLYQTNAIFSLGSAGAFILAYAIFIRLRLLAGCPPKLRRFWILFLPASAILGIAAAPVREDWGVAHLALQPHVLLALAALAGVATKLPAPWKILLLAGCALDFALGILLHVHLENRVFDLLQTANGSFTLAPSPHSLSHSSEYNFFLKQFVGLSFVGDTTAAAAPLIEIILCLIFAAILLWTGRVMFKANSGQQRNYLH